MIVNLFSAADWLQAAKNPGYGKLPIPQARDAEISGLLRTWAGMEEHSRILAAREILEEQRFTLLAYSERMASFAVRSNDPELIFLGLLALGVDGWRGDWRDNAALISLHYDAAHQLRVVPEAIFENTAALLPAKSAAALRSFLRRSAKDQSLEAMGYVAGTDSDGFRYKRTW
jgi:hypothetical protein